MDNIQIAEDEVILFQDNVYHEGYKLDLDMVLTNIRIVFSGTLIEKTGFLNLKKIEKPIYQEINLKDIKIYNNKVQVVQNKDSVFVQTKKKNFTIDFGNFIEARQFITKVIDVLTDSTMSDRGAEKTNNVINKVDNVLGFDTRKTIKGVIENGVVGTLFRGIKNRKNKK